MTSDDRSSVCSQLLETPGGDLLSFHLGLSPHSATSLGRRSADFLCLCLLVVRKEWAPQMFAVRIK